MPQRKIHLDILRILACFFVIVNHFDFGFFNYTDLPAGSISYWVSLFISVFCKFSVPLFFMISGALLLRKEESIKDLYENRVFKMVTSLFMASFIYFVFEKYIIKSDIAFSKIYTNEMLYHLWYIYAYIAYLMLLPFLRIIAKRLNESLFQYMLSIFIFIVAIIPTLELLFFNNAYHVNYSLTYTPLAINIFVMPLVGYYVEHILDVKKYRNTKRMVLLLCVNFSCILLSMYCSYVDPACRQGVSQTYINCFSAINAMTIYIYVKTYYANIDTPSYAEKALRYSVCTFGIYVLHMIPMRLILVNEQLREMYGQISFALQLIAWIGVSLVIFFITYIFVRVLHKNKTLAKYL